MIKEKLTQIGLTDYEATIYTLLLEEGSATARRIYTATGINRVTTYNILESLMKKGLASSLDTQKKKLFIAESPIRLIDFLNNKKKDWEEEKQKIEQNEMRLSTLLPELEVIYKSITDKPRVRFFEGLAGIRQVRDALLKKGIQEDVSVYEIFSTEVTEFLDKKVGVDREGMTKFNENLTKKGTQHYWIISSGQEKRPIRLPNHHVVYVPNTKYPVHASIAVYGDMISIVAPTGKMICLLIENSDIAQTLRTALQLAMKGIESEDVEK